MTGVSQLPNMSKPMPGYAQFLLAGCVFFATFAHAQDQTNATLVVVHESKMGKAFKLYDKTGQQEPAMMARDLKRPG